MFGIGMPEMILILAVALIVIGPKKLPDLAKSLGRAMGEFKKATSDLKESMEADTGLSEVKESFDDIKQSISFDNIEDDKPAPDSTEDDDQDQADSGEFKERKRPPEAMDDLKNAFDDMNTASGVEAPSGGTDHTDSDPVPDSTEEEKTQDEKG